MSDTTLKSRFGRNLHSYATLKSAFQRTLTGVLAGVLSLWQTADVVAQAPTVSYSSPQVYLINTAISNLEPSASNVPELTFRNVSTFAGTGTAATSTSATNGSSAINSTFFGIKSMVVDRHGNMYVAEHSGRRIRKIPADGSAPTTLKQWESFQPQAIVINSSTGDLYISIAGHRILRFQNTNSGNYTTQSPIYPSPSSLTDGNIVWLGSSTSGTTDASGTSARFNTPAGIFVDASNTYLYVADYGNNSIRRVTISSGAVQTVAFLNKPEDLVVDVSGIIYVTSTDTRKVHKISGGTVSDFAGSGTAGFLDGTATTAQFNAPRGIDMDGAGNFYVTDGNGTHAIRKITPSGVVTTLAGSGTGVGGSITNGVGTAARFDLPWDVIVDRTNSLLYVSDFDANRIQKVEIGGYVVSPSLPAGLTMAPTTGVISGTPTTLTPAADYTVTAYNSTDSANATLNITVANMPTIGTVDYPASLTSTSARCGGNNISDGGSPITARGVVWSTSPSPTLTNNKTSEGTASTDFISDITGLSPNTTYYVRAYVTSGAGTSYGSELSFTTLAAPPSAPTAVTARTGVNSAHINFTAPASNGGAVITNYEYALGTGAWTALSPAQSSSPLTISGLTACTEYSIKIRAVNAAGAGTESSAVTVTPRNGTAAGVTPWIGGEPVQANEWKSVTYGNGQFVAVASSGANRVMTSPDGVTWTARTAAAASYWSSVTYGNGLFVAVADFPKPGIQVMTSPDGITWTARTAAAPSSWRSVTYGNGLFVAVAYDGVNQVMTSPDGINWTARTAAQNNLWWSVTYGSGLFVAVSRTGTNRVMTSPDGINWTARAAAENNSWYSVTSGNGLFVAVSSSGTNQVMTSPDGITWTPRFIEGGNLWNSVTYGNGLFVTTASTGGSRVRTSTDGINWTARSGSSSNSYESVTYGNGVFVAVASGGSFPNKLMTSSEKLAPTAPTIGTITPAGTYATVAFTAPSDEGGSAITNYEYTTNGGSSWVALSPASATSPLTITGLTQSTAYTFSLRALNTQGGGCASATASTTTQTASVPNEPTGLSATASVKSASIAFTPPSNDGGGTITNYEYSINAGANWTALSPAQTASPLTISGLTSCTEYSVQIRAVNAAGGGTASSAVTVTPRDGILSGIWTGRTAPANNLSNVWESVAYGNGLYVAVASSGLNMVMTSPDAVTWTARTEAERNIWKSIAFGNGRFVAVASSGTNRVMSSTDGINWTTHTAAEANEWQSVTFGNNQFVAVAKSGNNRVMTSPDGITWTARAAAEANQWRAVTFGNNLYVAVALTGTNRVMTSPDGITWTARAAAEDNPWQSVAYGNGRYVAVASSGANTVMFSDDDGISWTKRTFMMFTLTNLNSITYGNGVFAASFSNNLASFLPMSTDGVSWNARTVSGGDIGNGSLTFGDGRFVVVSSMGANRIVSSSDALASGVPTIGAITPATSFSTSIAFTAPADAGSYPITGYEWSKDDGVTWNERIPRLTSSPMVIGISGSFSIRIRTVNPAGKSCPSASASSVSLMPTAAVTAITQNSATSGGNTPSLANITQRGVVWHTATAPTVALSTKTEQGTATGTFSSSLNSLAANTTYYIRSYVVYNGGANVEYGEQRSFKTNQDMSTWMSASPTKNFGDAAFNLTAPASNGTGQWTYSSSISSVATISGNTVTIKGVGSTTITATQAAVSPYAAATASYVLTVNGQTPVINLGIPLTTQIKDAPSLTITPTSNSGGTVTLTLGSGSISGVTLNPSGSSYTLSPVTTTGNLVFEASVAATGNYAAGTFTQTMDVTKNNPTITFGALSAVTYSSGMTQSLTATGGGSSKPVTFDVVSGPGASSGTNGSILNISGPGDIVIKASQDGDATHNPAPDVVRTLTVNAGPPTITGFTPVSATLGDVVTITGDNLLGATAVTFGETAVASYSVLNATTITAVLADGHTGSVSVTTPSGTGNRGGFRFKALWTGAAGEAFGTAENWTGNRPPQTGDDIVFSPTAESDLELSGPITAANVDFNGSTRALNLGSNNLTVTGNLNMPGTITGTGRVIMAGSSAQTINGGGSSLTDLEISNTIGGVTISESGGELVVTGRLRLSGGALNANGKLRLSSTSSGTARVERLGSGASITGDVIAERYIQQNGNSGGTGRAWRLVSVPVTGSGTLREFFMNGRNGQDLTDPAAVANETQDAGTPIVGHNYSSAAAATAAGFDWIGVANMVSSLRYYTGDAGGGSFNSTQVPSLSTTYTAADQGYMVFTRGDRKLSFPDASSASATTFRSTGTLKTGTQTVGVAPASTSKYTLVGNPYMSVLDLDPFYTTNSSVIKPSFWIWDANVAGTFYQGAYVNVYKSGDQWVTNTGTYTNPQLLESGMAFFVEPVSSGGTLTITEAHKSSETSAGLTPFSTDRSDDHGRFYVRLERSPGSGMPQIIDGVMADFHKDFKEALQDGSDREKMRNGISRGALWMSRENRVLSSQGLPWPKADSTVIPIYMSGVGNQTLMLRLDPRGMDKNYVKGWLRDKVLMRDTQLDMTQPMGYDFIGTGSPSWDSTRFELVFVEAGRPTTGGTALEPGGGQEQPSVRLYPNPSRMSTVRLSLRSVPVGGYRVELIDMTGRLVASQRLEHRSPNGEYRLLEGRILSPGKYLVRLVGETGPVVTLQLFHE